MRGQHRALADQSHPCRDGCGGCTAFPRPKWFPDSEPQESRRSSRRFQNSAVLSSVALRHGFVRRFVRRPVAFGVRTQVHANKWGNQCLIKPDLVATWEEHLGQEFAVRNPDAPSHTMGVDPEVNHVPTMTGGVGLDELKRFYKYHFVTVNPPDMAIAPISRTVGTDSIVDEMVIKFTHDRVIDYVLPGMCRRRGGRWRNCCCSWWSSFATESWPANTSIGIRLRCWCRSASSIRQASLSPESKSRGRCQTEACQAISSWRGSGVAARASQSEVPV